MLPCDVNICRIAGQQKRWVEGRVLVFDDSYEHEVRNGCAESRGVLQLVITHPALLQQ
jgi:aspartyl/asparaginyl beta-hydroxylase (cupin superfamily)